MYPISEILEVRKNNPQPSYLPIRNKNNNINWQIVTGLVLSYSLKHKIEESYGIEQFRDDCKAHFEKIIDEPDFWAVLERMYFSNHDIFRVSPMFLLFQSQFNNKSINSGSAADKRLGALFANLMGDFNLNYPMPDKLNFIEKQLLNKLDEKVCEFSGESPFTKEQSYLPFIAKCFQSDLAFLAEYPQYLLQELANTLRLYAFSWCAQLALNLDNWQKGEPQSKSLFSSLTRKKPVQNGRCANLWL